MAGALVGGLAGYGGGRMSAPPSTAQPVVRALTLQPVVTPTGRDETPEGLASALVELSTTLEVLRTTLEQTPSASSRTPAVETMSPEDTTELASSLRVLADALRQPSSGEHTYARSGRLEAPTWIDRRSAFDTSTLRQITRELDYESLERAVNHQRSAHLFMSRQEILSRFGKPDEIHTSGNGSTSWEYNDYDLDREGDSECVHFEFDGDLVVQFQYDYSA